MGFLDRLLGNDHHRAATKYAGQESATDRAARQRRNAHRRAIPNAASKGQAWEDADRMAERQRRGPYRR